MHGVRIAARRETAFSGRRAEFRIPCTGNAAPGEKRPEGIELTLGTHRVTASIRAARSQLPPVESRHGLPVTQITAEECLLISEGPVQQALRMKQGHVC